MRCIRPGMIGCFVALAPGLAQGEVLVSNQHNMYGTPGGLIDMPTAEMAPDGELSATVSRFGGTTKTTLTFQITPRLTGSFRYSALEGYKPGLGVVPPVPASFIYPHASYYDRSFDLRYQVLTEGQYRPGVAIGLRDFIGTGLYGAEYIVATKSLGAKVRLTAGAGWGRLGSVNGSRAKPVIGSGGTLTADRWFKGPIAAFGGISYAATDRLTFKAEYSSDAYLEERGLGPSPSAPTANLFSRKNSWNFGVDYKVSKAVNVGAYYMYGSELGVNVTMALNPKTSPIPGGAETAPLPVSVRPKFSARDLGWATQPGAAEGVTASVAQGIEREGMVLEGMKLTGSRARILLRNPRYDIESQAVGRAARVLSRTLPPSVETFEIIQTYNGVPTGSVTLQRSDIEALENAPAGNMLAKATFSSGVQDWHEIAPLSGTYPRLQWGLGPYVSVSTFDPDNPVRADVGAKLSGDYYLAPGWVASGAISVKFTGNLDAASTGRTGVVAVNPPPVVRSDGRNYAAGNDPKIDYLTIAKYGRIGPDWYGRVTAGYLEKMYAGVSGEVLWKPVDSRLAIGVELNYVAKRDYDQLFGVQGYNVATGHVSAYYDFGNGFHGQLDAGRYLAGDWGATVAIDREFDNGWRVGAYATKTNVSASSFGEGSFDKGIRVSIPLSWGIGTPTRKNNKVSLSSLTRDGGAKLNVNGRLYEAVRDTHKPEMAKTWGRFWR